MHPTIIIQIIILAYMYKTVIKNQSTVTKYSNVYKFVDIP